MLRVILSLAGLLLTLPLGGCGRTPPAHPTTSSATVHKTSAETAHNHKPSQHGGVIVSLGADRYHAEAVFERGGLLRLYMLDQDETKILEIDAQPLSGFVKAQGDSEAEPFTLTPDPTADDTQGKTSRFRGQLPNSLVGKKLEVTIPSIRIAGERFRLAFKSNPTGDEHAAMPMGAGDEEEERKLYLTPGGKYTVSDIQANGSTTASAKFKGIRAEHDMKPKPGDAICPITMTKANPKFSWIIAGKTYTFCCPPCVDEFVQQAKEKPDEIMEPEFYRKK